MKKTLCKRLLSLALVLAALLTLGPGALAADTAVVSNQKLTIDGENAPVTAYNIKDNNYFKLRDVAYLLSGTDARFSVDYDESTNSIRIVTGEAYTANGSELHPIGKGDKDAVKSVQTLYINGRKNSSMTAYNIDGYNYFKLRDLGDTLGFKVDYDADSRTMLILTREPEPKPDPAPAPQPGEVPPNWKPDISFTTTDMYGDTWTDACFAGYNLTVVNLWAYWCGPCISEMPDFQKLAQNYADKGVQIIGVYDAEDEQENIKKAKELGILYPCLRYTADFDPWMNTGYIPVTIFIDGNGKVKKEVYVGARNYSAWAEIIDGYLK